MHTVVIKSTWFKFILLLFGIMCLFYLCSCSKIQSNPAKSTDSSTEESTISSSEESTISSSEEPTDDIADKLTTRKIDVVDTVPELRYQSGQDSYVLQNGKLAGTIHFNLVQRLGIWDYNNKDVVANGVYYSYAFNMKLDFTRYLNDLMSAKIKVVPKLIDSAGNNVGDIAIIGWNGFDQEAELYNSSPVKSIEVCLQPINDIISDDYYVQFDVEDTENNVIFDSIRYDMSLLNAAEEGPAIKRIGETSKIKSINGAKYSFTLDHVYASNSYLNIDTYSDLVKMLDIDYTMKLLKQKVNNRVVTRFNTFDKVLMNSEVKLAVNTSNSASYNYTWYPNSTRAKYADIDEYVKYVTFDFPFIGKNESVTNTTNRVLSYDLDSKNPQYARVTLEFADERKSRTDDELIHFNGRYLVYQVKLEDRNLENYYTGE